MRDLFSVESGFSRTISGFSRTLSGFSRTVCGFSRTCGSCIAVMLLALLMAPGASLRSEQAPAPSADLAAIFSPGESFRFTPFSTHFSVPAGRIMSDSSSRPCCTQSVTTV